MFSSLWNHLEVFPSLRATVYSQKGGILNVQNFHFKCSWSAGNRQSDWGLTTHRVKATDVFLRRKRICTTVGWMKSRGWRIPGRRFSCRERSLNTWSKTLLHLSTIGPSAGYGFFVQIHRSNETLRSVILHTFSAVLQNYLNVGEGGGHLYKLFRIIFTVSEPDRSASIKISMRRSYYSEIILTVLIHKLTLYSPVRRQ